MTNQQIIDLAKSKGYAAKLTNGYDYKVAVVIGLKNRSVTISELSREMGLPPKFFYNKANGITIYGSDA